MKFGLCGPDGFQKSSVTLISRNAKRGALAPGFSLGTRDVLSKFCRICPSSGVSDPTFRVGWRFGQGGVPKHHSHDAVGGMLAGSYTPPKTLATNEPNLRRCFSHGPPRCRYSWDRVLPRVARNQNQLCFFSEEPRKIGDIPGAYVCYWNPLLEVVTGVKLTKLDTHD